MINYKYHLRKGSKKEKCPSCGKRTFVPYVDSEGVEAGDSFGRCDREDKCAYIQYPTSDNQEFTPKPIMQRKPTYYFDRDLVVKTIKPGYTTIFHWLYGINPERAKEVAKMYALGASKKWNGACIFWQIDEKKHIRTGKIMAYQIVGKDCKRVKSDRPLMTWTHAQMDIPDSHEVRQCLFGEHLIADKPIALVESEKTALFGAMHHPEYTWLATGGIGGFKADRLACLQSKNVVILPDGGCLNKWKAVYYEFQYLFNPKWVDCAIPEAEGADLVDLYLNGYYFDFLDSNLFKGIETPSNERKEFSKQPVHEDKEVAKMVEKNPIVGKFIEELSLTRSHASKIRENEDDECPF